MKISNCAKSPIKSAPSAKMQLGEILNQLGCTVGTTLTRRPVAATLGLGVVPSIWLGGSDRIIDYAFRAANSEFKWILSIFLWSVILPGQITYALSLIRGEPGRVRSLLRLDWSAFSAFVVSVCMTAIPHALHSARSILAQSLGGRMMIAQSIGSVIAFYISYRTIAWLPLIVDRNLSVKSALIRALGATRNQTYLVMTLLLILALLGIPFGLLFLLAAKSSAALFLFWTCIYTIGTLAYCSMYELLAPENLNSRNIT